MKNKIVDNEKMIRISKKMKAENKTIVQCHGVFDLIHPGHIKHFQAAKKFGDILVVSITEDKYVNKGPGRPVFNELLRAETIASLQDVDYVLINRFPTAITAIEIIQPDYYVKGQDYKNSLDDITGGIIEEKKAVEKFGGQLIFTEEVQFSSSRLLNKYLNNENEDLKKYLNSLKNKTSFKKIQNIFQEIANYHVLVIGDIILDEYQFVKPLGKSSKSATITSQQIDKELYAGGVLAVANHIADFVKKVTLITEHGKNDKIDYEDFIRKNLHKNIQWKSVFVPNRPTTLKRRFVEPVFKHKLFEVIEIEDAPLPEKLQQQVIRKIQELNNIDLIVIADFGHGLMDSNIIEALFKKEKFLAINAQTNSANLGFNLLTKYARCDYFSIDKEESQLAVHNKYNKSETNIKTLMERLQVQKASITLGVNGSIVGDRSNNRIIPTPILSTNVIDTIGAGDAFLSLTSLLARQGASIEEIGFIGNAAGAIDVTILGNKSYIEKIPLLKYIKTLLA